MMSIFYYTAAFGWFYQVLNNLCDKLSFLGKTIFTINNLKGTSNFQSQNKITCVAQKNKIGRFL